MRVLICGGREYFNDRCIDWIVSRLKSMGMTTLIEGEARGADSLARECAESHGIVVLPFPANWKIHRKKAGHIRNTQMLVEGQPDLVVAFPGGTGTANMTEQASRAKVRSIIL